MKTKYFNFSNNICFNELKYVRLTSISQLNQAQTPRQFHALRLQLVWWIAEMPVAGGEGRGLQGAPEYLTYMYYW